MPICSHPVPPTFQIWEPPSLGGQRHRQCMGKEHPPMTLKTGAADHTRRLLKGPSPRHTVLTESACSVSLGPSGNTTKTPKPLPPNASTKECIHAYPGQLSSIRLRAEVCFCMSYHKNVWTNLLEFSLLSSTAGRRSILQHCPWRHLVCLLPVPREREIIYVC